MHSPNPTKSNLDQFDTIPDAVSDLRKGKPVIIVDDEDRENEGDVVVAAEFASAAIINFMASCARGLICVPMLGADLDRLDIPMMVANPDGRMHASPFTVSVEAATGVTTGISTADRAMTISVLTRPDGQPGDIAMPGHVFPLRAHPDGVLGRRGHTEASIDLVKLAGLMPAAVICEIMNDDGTMARRDQLHLFAREHSLRIVTISDLHTIRSSVDGDPAPAIRKQAAGTNDATVPHQPWSRSETPRQPWNGSRTQSPGSEHRLPDDGGDRRLPDSGDQLPRDSNDGLTGMTEAAELPTKYGVFRVFAFVDGSGMEHLALVHGNLTAAEAPVVRVHSECLTGDALGSVRCDCGDQLSNAMKRISDEGSGLLLYLRQEGRGIGLANKIRAYTLQDQGLDTVEANQCLGFEPDERNYDVAVQMLSELGLKEVRLLTNNPAKIASLERGGVTVKERLPLFVSRKENTSYLQTKAEKLQHLL